MATASPAQIAARKAFVAKVRAGAFKKKAPKRKKNPQEDFAQPAAPKGPKAHRKMNPLKKMKGSAAALRLGHNICGWVQDGYPFKQALAIALKSANETFTAAQIREGEKLAREFLNFPDPIRVTKKGVVRRNPVSRSTTQKPEWKMRAAPRKKNPSAPGHRSPSMFCVHRVKSDGEPGAVIGKFPTKPLAVEYAKAYASAHKAQVGIIGKA